MPAADSRYVMGSPCGPLTRLSVCCCMPIFVFPAPCGFRLDGGQDAMAHRRRGFGQPVLPNSPVIFSAVSTFETQRVSRGKHRLLSVRRRRIRYTGHVTTDRGLCPVLRTRPDHTPPHICLPSTSRCAAMRALASRCFFSGIRRPALLPPASFRRTLLYHPCLRLPFASVWLGLDFARYACHNIRQHHLAAGQCPAHNNTLNLTGEISRFYVKLVASSNFWEPAG